jgi:ABC-type glycerol-3-phosphate transport system substrate-binding protein
VYAAALLLGACWMVGGCRPADRTADGRVIVSYWEKWTGFELAAMQQVVDDFNASQRRIEVRILPVSQIDVKLMLATAGGNPPDLAGLWSFSVPDFSEKGALTPINGALQRKGISRETFIPIFWDLCGHQGFQWAVPSTPASLALHYNRALFREAGLDPDAPPRTLAELETMNEKLTLVEVSRTGQVVRLSYSQLTPEERQARKFLLVRAGHLPQEPGWWLDNMGVWFGGSLYDGDRRITADAPGNLAAMRWFRETSDKYGIENLRNYGASGGNFASPQNPFLSGRVAMELQGVWMHNFVDKYAPDLDWGVAPFPAADPATKDVTLVESDVLVIPRGAPHAAEAFEFLAYLCQREPAEKLALGQRKFTALRDVSPAFYQKHPNPHIREFVRLANSPQARSVPRLGIWREYQEEMRIASGNALWQVASPEQALAQVQQRVAWRWERARARWDRVAEIRRKEWQNRDLP